MNESVAAKAVPQSVAKPLNPVTSRSETQKITVNRARTKTFTHVI